MEVIKNQGNRQEPYIYLDKAKNIFEIKGRSIISNPIEFYEPIFQWVREYCKNPNNKTKIVVELDYFNSSSFKILVDLFKEFSSLHNKGLQIIWKAFPNDDIIDEVEKIMEITGLTIEIETIEE